MATRGAPRQGGLVVGSQLTPAGGHGVAEVVAGLLELITRRVAPTPVVKLLFTTINPVENTSKRRLGPRASQRAGRRQLSATRLALLEMLEEGPVPVTLAGLVRRSGLHENTVRGHLEALAADGLVVRRRAEPAGRGRPAWLWASARTGESADHAGLLAGLAAALATTVQRTSPDPHASAVRAGREWGRDRASARPLAPGGDGDAARRRVVDLLDEAGFAPRADRSAGWVRLTRCPLLATARRHPDIVCGVHLGLVQGALAEYGADAAAAELVPFAEPGACLLRLGSDLGRGGR